jgi:hypothetical protein
VTTLVPQAQASAPDGAADLDSVLKAIAAKKPSSVPEKPTTAPKIVEVSDATKTAISRLNDDLSTTHLPSERRRLSPTELTELAKLGTDAKLVQKGVEQAVAAVKQAAFNHLDVGLETDNDPETLADYLDPKSGHYLVKGEQEIPGTGKRFVRELAQASPTITATDLKGLWEEGKISRALYYRLTRKVAVPRELDEAALLAELKKNPRVADLIAPAVQPGKITASFWIRDIKES